MRVDDKKRANYSIADAVLKRSEILHAQTICIYLPLPEEVDTKPIIEEFFRLKKTVVVPKVSGDRLELHAISSFNNLQKGTFGVLEPSDSCPLIGIPEVDVFIVPGIAFDTQGFRIGWGKGYYDTVLAGITVPRIGLAYDVQLIAHVPHTSYDVPMTVVITDKHIIER